ncbi:adenylate cyclase [Maribacter vaceletii]|uniref:Adenylate cyclase n=1 Tax=Maribacter vaceletii TaxID=1206816 RepID=A0A495EAZ6_9FLAO|nr:adenylate/guanylate cyclase domain-containing protein [Maribacter vaceletii]RKR13057.1 adenylate cyclase [Maribacter vaceletii]
MNFRSKRRLIIVRDYVIGWTLAFIFLSIVRGVGTIEVGSVQFEFWHSILISLSFGFFFGNISGYVQIFIEERLYKKISILNFIVLRLIYIISLLILIIISSYFIVTQFLGEAKGIWAFAIEPGSGAIYFYIIVTDIFLTLLRLINLMLGKNNLWQLFSGKFYTPREEERIFMFLDLHSSTKHAETLGHLKYSKLIQDCFMDLSVVIENEAEIYQYVGDEVILTWKLKDGLKNNNCINAFFNFKNQLLKKEAYYIKNYGVVPFFKAGLNSGIVTVTEVGKYKKEIAYHGDTINTAARIQEKCNAYKQEVLLSESLKNTLNTNVYAFNKLGSVLLKGKDKEVLIYSIAENK